MNDEKSKIAASTHFIMLGLNVFCVVLVWQFSSKGIFKTKGMTLTSDPAQTSVVLVIICLFVCNLLYAFGLFKQLRRKN